MTEAELLRTLGNRIKSLRTRKGLTQHYVAMKCGFAKGSMSRIEAGRVNPTIRTLHKISRVLEIPLAEFFR
ncbi:MAG TPA: helix-turn-helix transcriptional regulator [Ferruginibacter sp.]|nr:helix-turn-helix transcriptional regulator [Ferruginibacter sp.]